MLPRPLAESAGTWRGVLRGRGAQCVQQLARGAVAGGMRESAPWFSRALRRRPGRLAGPSGIPAKALWRWILPGGGFAILAKVPWVPVGRHFGRESPALLQQPWGWGSFGMAVAPLPMDYWCDPEARGNMYPGRRTNIRLPGSLPARKGPPLLMNSYT